MGQVMEPKPRGKTDFYRLGGSDKSPPYSNRPITNAVSGNDASSNSDGYSVLDTDFDSGDSGGNYLGGIADYFSQKKRRKDVHKTDILKVLSIPFSEAIPGLSVDFQYEFGWAEHEELYGECLSHLSHKKYRPLTLFFEGAMEYANKTSKELVDILKVYKNSVGEKLDDFGLAHSLPLVSYLPTSDHFLGNVEHFVKPSIIEKIFQNVMMNRRNPNSQSDPWWIGPGSPKAWSAGGQLWPMETVKA